MLSRSFESPDAQDTYLHDVSEPAGGSLQDDVEQLLDIAGQLFSAMERQIHCMEEDLVRDCGEQVREYAQTVFKERLIRCAESLDVSIKKIDLNLERRASELIATYGLRDDS
jgi:hypothetical protein